jgi:hypothetical protein
MLPRVTAALGKFLTPIVSSSENVNVGQKGAGFQRFKTEKQDQKKHDKGGHPPSKPELKLVPPTEEKISSETELQPTPRPVAAVPLLYILNLINLSNRTLRNWFGLRAYQIGLRTYRKSGKARKGAMFDQKIE